MVRRSIFKAFIRFRAGFYDDILEEFFQCTLPLAFALACMLCSMLIINEMLSIRESGYRTGDDPYSYMVVDSKIYSMNASERSVTLNE